jgi:hypothetical protein
MDCPGLKKTGGGLLYFLFACKDMSRLRQLSTTIQKNILVTYSGTYLKVISSRKAS